MRSRQPAGDLLRRPIQSQLPRHGLSQLAHCPPTYNASDDELGPRPFHQPAPLGIHHSRHCGQVLGSPSRAISQQPGQQSGRLMRRKTSGDLLALRKRQCQPRATPRSRTNSLRVELLGNKWTMTAYRTLAQSLLATPLAAQRSHNSVFSAAEKPRRNL